MDLKTFFFLHDVTQVEIARAVGVTPSMVSQWVSGHRPIAAENVIPLEEATKGACPRYELRPDIYPPNEYRVA